MLAGSKLKPIFVIFVVVSFGLAFLLFMYLNKNSHYPTKRTLLKPNGFNVLVTGGAGFIGSHIVQHFQENEPNCENIYVLDNLTSGKKSNIEKFDKVEFVEGSINDKSVVNHIMEMDIKFVFHLGARVSAVESVYRPHDYVVTNTLGTINLLEAAAEHKVKSFVFSSSSAIYGKDERVPKTEDMKPQCTSPYAITKYDGEFYLSQYEDKMNVVALRYFNVFGERQDPNSQYSGKKKNLTLTILIAVIPQFITKGCLDKQDLSIFGDGKQTRDFVYVKDVVSANVYCAKNVKKGIFNVGYEQSLTINDLGKVILDECKSTAKITHKPARPGDVKVSMASTKALRATGWKPKYEFKSALKQTVRWFLEN
eukprot:gene3730-6618_t